MKKIQKSTKSENRQVAFTFQLYKLRRTKTSQSNYKICQNVKVRNSQLSLHITWWIFKKSKQWNACIRSRCGYCLWVWMCLCRRRINNVYFTNMPSLIRKNLKALPSYQVLTGKILNERTSWNKPFFQVGLWE